MNNNLKVWVEISSAAVAHNIKTFRRLLGPKVKLWSVVKSNAYGHGIYDFTPLADKLGADGFCVDSVIEGVKLREQGIRKPILVLGPTLDGLLKRAKEHRLTLTIASGEGLKRFIEKRHHPAVHFKIDTGMRRQGFYLKEVRAAAQKAARAGIPITGICTHFASAKDLNYPTFTDLQFHEFKKAIGAVRAAGFKKLMRHAAATGGTLLSNEYHLDAVRVGAGLYGFWPSRELQTQLGQKIALKPVLSWHTRVSEVKRAEKGDYVGYDLTERLLHATHIAVLPIGYWYGFDRGLSSTGEVLIGGKRAKVLGRVSMDLVVVDVGRNVPTGARVTLIGRQGREEITAEELALKTGTTAYEILTRVNPLIHRAVR